MFSLEFVVMIGVILFCVGGLLGAVISRSVMPAHGQRELEERLRASRQELAQYQQDVAHHFAETSQLVNKLTQNYREVHEHLARGAMELTNAEIGHQMLAAGEAPAIQEEDRALEDRALEEVPFEPPKDWAPNTPGQTGTLSEEFGLHDTQEEHDIASTTAKRPHTAE